MAEPERYENEEPEPGGTPTGPKPDAKPDWLVSAHEALESEMTPGGEPEPAAPDPRAATPQPPRSSGPRPPNPYEGFAQSAAGRIASSNWVEASYTAPDPSLAGARAAAEPPEPEADPSADASDELAGPETPTAATEKAYGSPLPPPKEAWWELLLARVFTPVGLAALGAVVIVIIAASLLFGPKDNSVPLSKIRRDPVGYDGKAVKVSGKVGEVYPVGGGYSFYLLQGRDTIVVFTRSRTPVPNERVSVSGVISTGVLNGAPRQALLETSPTP